MSKVIAAIKKNDVMQAFLAYATVTAILVTANMIQHYGAFAELKGRMSLLETKVKLMETEINMINTQMEIQTNLIRAIIQVDPFGKRRLRVGLTDYRSCGLLDELCGFDDLDPK
ncbi:hypothetical protein PtrSN002B_002311 [Pyrenophora tritici-repentis]|uniref:Uncharacterized protein n=2 Tax=Pyrenophora tritici-repentis TaxID=45151 RepID=A0A2W1E941_9PLEO|nr:uncharacterized protein PTRG_08941 [Pyrenophora tritici-repentis Pt-1C-BFP]KAA8627519.1 hypothetical protein PtrV1_03199 [Pyrenophora tritici-repentis]EDU41992.1 predicted protein [Pyrenophora tritici-repentis Pt-1C-BFP]KAF7442450.1 hypothetical protein A1F99_133190 [Pyrenophora tritici-repentis]KAF7579174.1 hypothetical protein PtrM4_034140 [Pyrenophora tritici-repentis]KAG9378107.1 hypothetical protein A1F94_011223 [Pyrenophora tritici-repentis]